MHPASPRPGSTRAPEIQALRALAVLGVVTWHLWPGRLPGGFVGVDVFFVISGFLITGHLARELAATGRVRLGRFWARRARRLLPAGLLVLTATAVAVLVAVPERYWQQFFREIAGSALYVQNWVLAGDSVDYLRQTNDPSPAQHYWSLSVEEQFYLVWPLLLAATWWLASRARRGRRGGLEPAAPVSRRVLAAPLVVVLAASFAWCVHLTATDPGPAYFVTPTRAWEFAAGGVLALVLVRREGRSRLRAAASWLGLAGIAGTFLAFDSETAFPGWAALLPVAATVLVLWAGDPTDRWAPGGVTRLAPVQWLGDVSYGLYLWHWPLIVIVPFVVTSRETLLGNLALLLASLVLAALTKRFVEDPVRGSRRLSALPSRWTLVGTAVAMAPVLVAALVVTAHVADRQQQYQARLDEVVAGDVACLGAAVVDDPGCENPELTGEVYPDTSNARADDVNSPECWSRNGEVELEICTEQPEGEPTLRVALVGDSHSNQYLSAVRWLSRTAGWQVDVIGKTGCIWTGAQQVESPSWVDDCETWKRSLAQHLATGEAYDVVLTSASAASPIAPGDGTDAKEEAVRGFEAAWAPVVARGTPVVAVRDNPETKPDYLTCVDRSGASAGAECAVPEETAFRAFDGQPDAVRGLPGAHLVDLSRYFCQDGSCPPVIGDVLVYRDPGHVTSTYARTLAPMLQRGVEDALAGR